jgi:predicted enzyme related to lactoylglutathione lyase
LPRVVHFDINANKPEELAKFYEQVFNWKFEKWKGPMDYWLITTGENEPGIDGGLSRR